MHHHGIAAEGMGVHHQKTRFPGSCAKMRGLLQYMGFVLDLEDAFGCHVDVVTDGIEDQTFLNAIKRDEVILYEAS